MRCALCLQAAALRDSHIIPEFLHRALYDDKHRFREISTFANEKNSYMQKGKRERLLCGDCEQRFSVWERYASQFFAGGLKHLHSIRKDDRLYVGGFDYKPLKLFQLSILWRASVSRLSEFAQVELGPHAETIRVMLLNEDPGTSELYGCVTVALMMDAIHMKGLIVPPSVSRLDGQVAYRFVIGGYIFVYPVSTKPPGKAIRWHFLQEAGTVVVKIEQLQDVAFLMNTFDKVMAMGRFEK